jgi:hypothetical protein
MNANNPKVAFPTVAKAYEDIMEYFSMISVYGPHPNEIEITEYDVFPPDYHLPDAINVLDWIMKHIFTTYSEVEEPRQGQCPVCFIDEVDLAVSDPYIISDTEAVLDKIASRISWRMCNNKLRTHMIIHDIEDTPMLNGRPLYATTTNEA